MKIIRLTTILMFASFLLIGLIGNIYAKEEVGTVVAIRGKALIERNKRSIEAKVKDILFISDAVLTMKASRAKLLFIDDSVLTLGENSKVFIRDVIYTKHKMGQSVFSLLEGKLRAIVGKTHFEVHTPTAVAAARGTILLFETGVTEDGKRYTIIICTEGMSTIMSTDPSIEGSITLTEGMMVTFIEGELSLPTPTLAPIELIEELLNSTDSGIGEISIPGPLDVYVGPEGVSIEPTGMLPTATPPLEQQPVVPTTPVDINIIFPDQ